MGWSKIDPTDDALLINFPGKCRANWEAIEALLESALQITNAKVAAGAGIVDTKLAQIVTPGKVSGAAIVSLSNIPAGAGQVPLANLQNVPASGFVMGDLIVSTVTTARTGWTNVSATYANKFMRISATPLSAGGADTFSLTLAEANLPGHTHAAGTLIGPAHTHTIRGAINDAGSGYYNLFLSQTGAGSGTTFITYSCGGVAVTDSTRSIGSGKEKKIKTVQA